MRAGQPYHDPAVIQFSPPYNWLSFKFSRQAHFCSFSQSKTTFIARLNSVAAIGTVLFETRFGTFSKSPSVEAAKFIEAVDKLFKVLLKVFFIPVWIDKFYRLKSIQEFYDCMDVLYNFGDVYIQKKMREIQEKLESGDIQDEDAAEFLTFLVSRDDISSKEITANLVEILMAAVETVWCNDGDAEQ